MLMDLWIVRENGQYTGKDSKDRRALRYCGAPVTFTDDNYNDVLQRVSQRGYCLAEELVDN